MSEQPKALALAEHLEAFALDAKDDEIAAELRRLHAVNAQMLEALSRLLPHVAHLVHSDDDEQSVLDACVDRARAAIAAAKDQT